MKAVIPQSVATKQDSGANGGTPVDSGRGADQVLPRARVGPGDLAQYAPDLDLGTFNARQVRFSKRALDAWDAPPWQLERLLHIALTRGYYWRTPAGGHLLEVGRHQMLLTRDGRLCSSYVLLPELAEPASGPPVDDLTPPAWDREAVVLAPRAVRLFTGWHRVSEEQARIDLFGLLDEALARGDHAANNGRHWLWLGRHGLELTQDGKTVVGYQTRNLERSPARMRRNAPARSGGGRHPGTTAAEAAAAGDGAEAGLSAPAVPAIADAAARDRALAALPAGQWVPAEEIRWHFTPQTTMITSGIISRERADRALHVQVIRDALQRAVFRGRWEPGTDGRHLLIYEGRRWTIAANGKGALSCDPPWPAGEDGAGLSPEERAIPLAQDRSVAEVPPKGWVSTVDVRASFDPQMARITADVIGWDRSGRAKQVKAIRAALQAAAVRGLWRPGSQGRHLLSHDGREWVIAAHGNGVLACDPAWPGSQEFTVSQRDQPDPQPPVTPSALLAAPASRQVPAVRPAAALAGWLRRLRPRSPGPG